MGDRLEEVRRMKEMDLVFTWSKTRSAVALAEHALAGHCPANPNVSRLFVAPLKRGSLGGSPM